jgi:hypothetical protein
VGIGIGVTAAVTLLVGLAWYIGRRGAIKRQEMTNLKRAAMPAPPGHHVQPDRHCYISPASELNTGPPLAEVPSGDRRYELWSNMENRVSVFR